MKMQLSPLEREALEFVDEIQRAYLERRDLAAVLSGMDAEITWLGSGRQESCEGLEQAERALSLEFQEAPGGFTIIHSDYRVEAVSDRTCVVWGELSARSGDPLVEDLNDRISAVCIKRPEGMRLLHLHLSHADRDQGAGRYYLRRGEARAREELKTWAKENARRLEAQGRELAALTENIPGGIYQCRNDRDYSIISTTSGFLSLVGYTREELWENFQDRLGQMIVPGDLETVRKAVEEQLAGGDTIEVEYRIRRRDGTVIWVMDQGKRVVHPDGSETIYCMLLDITAQRTEREELRLSLERHRIIMDQATDIIFEWDIRENTLLFSKNWRKKFGYDPVSQEISRRIPLSENIYPEDIPNFVKIMTDTAAGTPYSETEFRIRDIQGRFTWCRIRATTQYDNAGRAIKAVGVIVDIDKDKKQRQRLEEQAQRDGLTGLLNKAAAQQAVEEALDREGENRGAMLIIDLDGFKGINDRYGHVMGDEVLSGAAAVLKKLFRPEDVTARIGGDEFLVYLSGAAPEKAEEKGGEILDALREIPIFGRKGQVSGSVGAAVRGEDARSFSELYRCADLALYQVKNTGRRGFCLYTPELSVQNTEDGVIRSAVNAVIDSDGGVVNATLSEYCFRLLYRAIEPTAAVNQILEIVGRAYDVSRVYIFESSEDGLRCSNTFEWCGDGVEPEMEKLQNLSYWELGDYTDNFDKNGVFYCGDTRALHPALYAVLEPQKICSMLQCAIVDDGQFRGYVGFDECRENRHWTREQVETLTLVANVLSTFLVKLRLKERLSRMEGARPEEKV